MFVVEGEKNMSFAEKILSLRTAARLSQEGLAEKLDVSRQAVSKWESGVTLPETDKLIYISNMFGVSLDYLLKDDMALKPASHNTESLDRVVLRFLGSAQDMDSLSKILINVIQDGVVDAEERKQLNGILEVLDSIIESIQDIKLKIIED